MKEKKRILIIEDDPSFISFLKENLKDKYLLAVAKNGSIGIKKALSNHFDIILLDIILEGIDGFTVCQNLKANPITNKVPILILSSQENIQSILKGFDSGASDYLHKPFHPQELHKRIEVHLKMNDLNNQLTKQASVNIKKKLEFSQFITNLAHELRSPLNSIIGFSEILNDPEIEAEDRQGFLRHINQGGHNLLRLLNDLIDYSKIEAETLNLHYSQIDIEKELKDLAQHTNDELLKNGVLQKNIIFKSQERKEKLFIHSDIVRILQIITNFIDNAIKFSRDTDIILAYEINKYQLKIYVQDFGIGMTKEELDSLFFVGSSQSGMIKLKEAGKGLGLAISNKLAHLLNGKISVESQEGKGSTFSLSIPLVIDSEKDFTETTSPQTYKWSDKLLLIAEDMMVNFLFYQALLKKTGVKIIHAKNGEEVLDLLIDYKPDLILMDMVMPKMDGLEATLCVRKLHPEIPIIAQSSVNSYEDKETIYRAGCNDIISKPIKPQILLSKINRFFE
ncbi:MAG: hypothetical protein B7C24_04930 [Bacteroidetes bacterium 4572_77]|nr:MAG: hypothetical protein B7C24_04930 [Bacteroidetes bacterium 4572_77]